MKRIFTLLFLSFIILSCATKKISQKDIKIIKAKPIGDTVYVEKIIHSYDNLFQVAVLDNFKISNEHFPSQGQDFRQKFLILHYTALHNEKSLQVLTQQAVSAHYLISDKEDENIDLLVSENRRAWHAGVSEWKGRTNINDSSIGIEIVNLGYSTINDKKRYYPFTPIQIKKVATLAKNIIERYGIDPTYVLGHSDIAPNRKEDPGAFFPWKRLYEEYGVGAWYNDVDKYKFLPQYPRTKINQASFIKSVQQDLKKYGYGIEETGNWDKQTQRTIMAFQLHFRPSNYDGYIDAETWAILQALNKKYRD